jgi:hypothetical protein
MGGEVVLDNNGRLSILTDDNHWREVVSLGQNDYGRVADAPKSGVAIFLGGYNAAVIAPKHDGGYSSWTVARNDEPNVSFNFYVSKPFGEAFYFGRSWLFDLRNPRWLRVTPAGFGEIDEGAPQSRHVHELRIAANDVRSAVRDRNDRVAVVEVEAVAALKQNAMDVFEVVNG